MRKGKSVAAELHEALADQIEDETHIEAEPKIEPKLVKMVADENGKFVPVASEAERTLALQALEARVWILEQMHTAEPAPYRTKEGYMCSRCQQLITKGMVCGGVHLDECPHKQ